MLLRNCNFHREEFFATNGYRILCYSDDGSWWVFRMDASDKRKIAQYGGLHGIGRQSASVWKVCLRVWLCIGRVDAHEAINRTNIECEDAKPSVYAIYIYIYIYTH